MRIKVKSLQLELYLWIFASTVVITLVGAIFAGSIAFFQARELQDNTLIEISLLLKNGRLNPPEKTSTLQSEMARLKQTLSLESKKNYDDFEDDASIILFELKAPFSSGDEKYLAQQKEGLQTLELMGEQWRALVLTPPQSGRTFFIAQPTELRDEIASASAVSTLYPIIIFVVCLLVLVHLVLRKQFRSVKQLANSVDQQDGSQLNALNEQQVPSEIQPFIRSINALMQRVQSTLSKQQRFIADAAHELRTPIAALSLQADNLKNASNPQEQQERLTSLQQGFLRLGKLVGQLLDLARLQASRESSALNKERLNLNEAVKNAVQDLYPLAEKGQVDLGVVRQDPQLMVEDSKGLLAQLIQNAIANAIAYTPEGGEVNISLFQKDKRAVLLVEDTGVGIPEEDLEKVMQPFYRALGSGKEGNGLGLTISQEIADKLGGKITLANRKSGGLLYRYEQTIVT